MPNSTNMSITEPFESHRTCMNGLFKQLDELFDSVIDILVELQRDELMTPLLDYFKDEEAEYMHYLHVLDSAVVNLGRSVQPVWEPFQGSIKPNPIASLPEQFTQYLNPKSPVCFRKSNHVWIVYCIVLYCIMRPYTDGPIRPLSYRHSSGVVRNPHSTLAE